MRENPLIPLWFIWQRNSSALSSLWNPKANRLIQPNNVSRRSDFIFGFEIFLFQGFFFMPLCFFIFLPLFSWLLIAVHYNWKVSSRLSGYFTKFLQKIAEKYSRQSHIKRKSDITQTSFFVLVVNQSAVQIPNRPLRLIDGFVKSQKVIPL